MADPCFTTVSLDLSALCFLDAAGLRVIVTASERARAEGRRLTLTAPRPALKRVFTLTGTDAELDWTERWKP